jgi:hypothetical protein
MPSSDLGVSVMEIVLRYDGPGLAAHDIDALELGKSLIALSNLIQESNRKFNGDANKLNIIVNADIKQNCFQLSIKIIEIYNDNRELFSNISVGELSNLLGLTRNSLSLLRILIELGGNIRKRRSAKNGTSDSKSADIPSPQIPDDTPPKTRLLLEDPRIVRLAQDVLRPGSLKGYNTVGFYEKTGSPLFEASSEEVFDALEFTVPPSSHLAEGNSDGSQNSAVGYALVRTSHFEGSAKWNLKWQGRKISVKMPEEFLKKFQNNEIIVVPNTQLLVRICPVPQLGQQGMLPEPEDYAVEEVLDLQHPPNPSFQPPLFP